MKSFPLKYLAISPFHRATSASPSSLIGRSLALLVRSSMSSSIRLMHATRSTMRSSELSWLSVFCTSSIAVKVTRRGDEAKEVGISFRTRATTTTAATLWMTGRSDRAHLCRGW
jgi:hypothetical protein